MPPFLAVKESFTVALEEVMDKMLSIFKWNNFRGQMSWTHTLIGLFRDLIPIFLTSISEFFQVGVPLPQKRSLVPISSKFTCRMKMFQEN